MTISRRELFGWLRAPERRPPDPGAEPPPTPRAIDPDGDPDRVAAEATPAAFSLDAFYAGRTADRALPAFAIRATASAPTTRVGLGRTEPAGAPAAPSARDPEPAATPIPPALAPEILPHRCLATRSFCSVCVERCPIPGAIVVEHGRPRVDAARCDGCGHCVAACPAPILAFALVTRPTTTGPR